MKKLVIVLFSLCFAASLALADTLELKNGSVIKGTYAGGTETHVSFRVGATVQQYAVSDIASLTFEATPAPKPQALEPPAGTVSAPLPAQSTVTVPTGTRLLVRTIDAVDSSKNQVGDTFSASLEEPLYVNETLIAPKGAQVYGRLEESKTSGHLAGRAELRLTLTGIVINQQTIPLSTGDYQVSGSSRGASTAKKAGAGAAVGAVIGAIAGGGKGAAIGAGVGAGAGTAVQVVTHGDRINVPSETLLEFSLDQPVNMPVTQSSQSR